MQQHPPGKSIRAARTNLLGESHAAAKILTIPSRLVELRAKTAAKVAAAAEAAEKKMVKRLADA